MKSLPSDGEREPLKSIDHGAGSSSFLLLGGTESHGVANAVIKGGGCGGDVFNGVGGEERGLLQRSGILKS